MTIPILLPSPLSSLLTAPIIIIAHYSYSYIISPPPRPRLEAPAIAQSSLGGLLRRERRQAGGKPEALQPGVTELSPSVVSLGLGRGWRERTRAGSTVGRAREKGSRNSC